jgi:DNA ligase (NAD+)
MYRIKMNVVSTHIQKNLPTEVGVLRNMDKPKYPKFPQIEILEKLKENETKNVKPKRKYTRKNLKKPLSPIQLVSTMVVPSPKVVQEVPIVKPKRKYTRKIKAVPSSVLVSSPVLVPSPKNIQEVKPKRKYTRKSKPTDLKIIQNMHVSEIKPKESPVQMSQRNNESYIQLMKDLAYIMRTRKDPMRARAYDQARETIENVQEDITTPTQLKDQPGIGPAIYKKLVIYSETGTLPVLQEEAATIKTKRAMDIFTDIYGVGEKKAEELVTKHGITTLEQLEARQDELLNSKQKVGLKYYRDILERIPRSEIVQYEALFQESVKTLPDADLKLQIVGSYRRGLSSSGDIDAILTSQKPELFSAFIDTLISKNIIVEVLSRGPSKCLVITRLPGAAHARRVDFLYTTVSEFPFAILYFTGSKGFNTAMRNHALSMGYTLNEHGFSKMDGKKKGAAVDRRFADEAAIFAFLKLMYKAPQERVDGRDIVPISMETAAPVPTTVPVTVTVPAQVKPKIVRKKIIVTEAPQEPVPLVVPLVLPEPVSNSPQCNIVQEATINNILQFKTQGKPFLDAQSEPTLADMIQAANNAFHCIGKPVMTDAEYDIIHQYMENRFPKNPALQEVGAPIEKNKAILPYEMASMDKIKPDTQALTNWKAKYPGPYVISCKLDGVSGLYTTESGTPKLYTRGDGKVGQDVTYLIPHLKLPKDGTQDKIAIRGEFIIKRSVFDQKYKAQYANSRNLVAGVINAKSLDDRVRDVDFVAYEVISPMNLTPSQQMNYLEHQNIITVKHQILSPDELTNDRLSALLQDWRTNHTYEIDGIIVSDDHVYPRTSGNPDHSFAFKMVLSDQIAETHVVDVEWVASKDGYLKPTVHVEPVTVGGVTIRKATGFNADFIEKNKIGIGAIVQIIRSGDVIPYIKSVTAPAMTPKMPAVPYVWNATHVDVLLENMGEDMGVRTKQITAFFQALEVVGLGEGNAKKIVATRQGAANFNTIPKVIHMSEQDLMGVEGFQTKTAQKLHTGIQTQLQKASLPLIMAASNQLGRGFGKRTAEAIITHYPNVFDPLERNTAKLAQIEGIGKKTAEEFVAHIPQFLQFLQECGLEYKLHRTDTTIVTDTNVTNATPGQPDTMHPLYNKTVVMTGFRNKDLEANLKKVGAKSGASVNKSTFALLVKDKEDVNQRAESLQQLTPNGAKRPSEFRSGKVEDAKKYNIPIYSAEEFIAKYFV